MSPVSRSTATSWVLAAALTAGLTGCGTGLQAQTYKEKGRQDFASVDLDRLAVRDLHLLAPSNGTIPAGGSATLVGVVVNRGGATDRLRDVSTDAATGVALQVDGKPATGVALPPGSAASTWTAVLSGLTRPLRAGDYITVTLTFADAGRTTLDVPVQNGDNGLGSRTVDQSPYGEGG